ncbi:MAG: hypothetical protein ABJE95_03815 [Byssovorax sp.]
MPTSDAISNRVRSLVFVPILVVAGCALDSGPVPGSSDEPSLGEMPGPGEIPVGHAVLGEFVMRVDPRQKTLSLSRLGRAEGPARGPESFDNVSIEQDGKPGTGTVNNVELVTNSITFGSACSGGNPASFCGNVTLRSFYTRPLNNVYVQVTSVVDVNGQPLSTFHGGINSDASPALPATQLDASQGLWRHPPTGASPNFLGTTATSNSWPRNWVFADPDGATTTITLRVVASLTYQDYVKSTSTAAFIDACTLAGGVTHTLATASNTATMPFAFTFYGVSGTTQVTYNRNGVFSFGANAPPTGDNGTVGNYTFKNKGLPENPAVVSTSPAAYAFWDGLNGNPGALVCHGTSGAAPSRKFVITWKNLKGFNDPDNSTNLTFSAIMSEGIDTIDYVYSTMTGAAGNDTVYPAMTNVQRAAGKNAVIGVQGPNGAVNISTPFPASIGGIAIAGGTKFRFTPVP